VTSGCARSGRFSGSCGTVARVWRSDAERAVRPAIEVVTGYRTADIGHLRGPDSVCHCGPAKPTTGWLGSFQIDQYAHARPGSGVPCGPGGNGRL